MGKKLFVGGLPYETNDVQLRDLFSAHGKVMSAKVIIDKLTNRSKGFGFVEMSTDDEAKAAATKLNNATVGTRRIIVNEARPPEPRPAGGYPPRSSPGGPPAPPPGAPGFGGPAYGDRKPSFSDRRGPDRKRKPEWEQKKKDRDGEGPKKGRGGPDDDRRGRRGGGFDDDGDEAW
jgi:RNA recognition motif-containing protein